MVAMHCLSCEHPNSATAKFCEHCGSALNLRLCNQCEAVNNTEASHCHRCNAPLAPARIVRKRGARIALASAGVVALAGAAGAFYVLDRTGLEAAQVRATPATPALADRKEPEAAAAAAEAPARPKPAARTVTHTRATPPAPAEVVPLPAALPDLPLENAAPPVTHTRRAVATPETRTGSN